MYMKNRVIQIAMMAAALAGLLCLPAVAQSSSSNGKTSKLTASERQFLKEAAEGGKQEVELGKIAQTNAQSPAVKEFGERMVNDHSKANEQLEDVASKEGVTLPQQPNAMQRAQIEALSKLKGEAFDHAYMKDMVKDHTKDVSEFRHASKNATNPAVREFATQTLPVLESHLNEAKKITGQKQTAMK